MQEKNVAFDLTLFVLNKFYVSNLECVPNDGRLSAQKFKIVKDVIINNKIIHDYRTRPMPLKVLCAETIGFNQNAMLNNDVKNSLPDELVELIEDCQHYYPYRTDGLDDENCDLTSDHIGRLLSLNRGWLEKEAFCNDLCFYNPPPALFCDVIDATKNTITRKYWMAIFLGKDCINAVKALHQLSHFDHFDDEAWDQFTKWAVEVDALKCLAFFHEQGVSLQVSIPLTGTRFQRINKRFIWRLFPSTLADYAVTCEASQELQDFLAEQGIRRNNKTLMNIIRENPTPTKMVVEVAVKCGIVAISVTLGALNFVITSSVFGSLGILLTMVLPNITMSIAVAVMTGRFLNRFFTIPVKRYTEPFVQLANGVKKIGSWLGGLFQRCYDRAYEELESQADEEEEFDIELGPLDNNGGSYRLLINELPQGDVEIEIVEEKVLDVQYMPKTAISAEHYDKIIDTELTYENTFRNYFAF